jgi:hypothetical protein
MGKLLEDGGINVLRIMFTERLTAQFDLCDAPYGTGLTIRQEYDPVVHYLTRLGQLEEQPDKFSVFRQDHTVGREAEAICGWSKAKSVFTLRRPEPLEKPVLPHPAAQAQKKCSHKLESRRGDNGKVSSREEWEEGCEKGSKTLPSVEISLDRSG